MSRTTIGIIIVAVVLLGAYVAIGRMGGDPAPDAPPVRTPADNAARARTAPPIRLSDPLPMATGKDDASRTARAIRQITGQTPAAVAQRRVLQAAIAVQRAAKGDPVATIRDTTAQRRAVSAGLARMAQAATAFAATQPRAQQVALRRTAQEIALWRTVVVDANPQGAIRALTTLRNPAPR